MFVQACSQSAPGSASRAGDGSHEAARARTRFELRFNSLTAIDPGYAFPCDHAGWVDMDLLTERDRIDYLFARGSVGYALSSPAVLAVG